MEVITNVEDDCGQTTKASSTSSTLRFGVSAIPSSVISTGDEGEESSEEDGASTSSSSSKSLAMEKISGASTSKIIDANAVVDTGENDDGDGETSSTPSDLLLPDWKTRSLQRKQKAAYLASQYPPAKQRLDKALSFIYCFVMMRLFYNLLSSLSSLSSLVALLSAFALAALWADFVSGMLHWACDTYGSVDTPVVGKLLIRSFREHHIDPTAITRHPFFETNGNSILATLPFAVILAFNPPTAASGGFYYFLMCYLTCSTLLLSFTNQIHKWAHSHEPPSAVRALQKMGVILEGRAHQKHHFRPYDRDYCITTGWLNPLFEKIDYWRRIEDAIQSVTGAVPRKDDQNWSQPGAAPKQD
ncbi:ubiquitin-conjugating enzyme, putative [Acanthamoeba castellanii str. Neff]|uniref:Ubiquitin-conjugating enzyme, putative n=1 Tax=Acanthamoeba castellanii (strain ATCC 30010 / Neff) TaxID=1257118 RepID=L8HKY1_ACACF|nr:ubiquitin-conjugating enzyme, putative [Acanthamoeba castellanii str. Neff]ELR25036.1 ubiquitin-conjugating enzyme, putative [Acanthamoeba castellanii str. Neff]